MSDDQELVENFKKGNKLAFEQLVLRYDRLVLNIAYSYKNNKDDADDIYQEVFLRVYKGLKNFQSRSKFSTWLYRITVNVCIEHKRKQKLHSHDSITNEDGENILENILESEENTSKTIVKNETSRIIKKEVHKLPKQLKMAFTLKYYQGLKIKEIADMMNCTEGTIKSYLFASSRKLRESLKPILEM